MVLIQIEIKGENTVFIRSQVIQVSRLKRHLSGANSRINNTVMVARPIFQVAALSNDITSNSTCNRRLIDKQQTKDKLECFHNSHTSNHQLRATVAQSYTLDTTVVLDW